VTLDCQQTIQQGIAGSTPKAQPPDDEQKPADYVAALRGYLA
jgi:hypothetical protein